MTGLERLQNQQSFAYICGPLGHSWAAILPIQIRHETREVLVSCRTCHTASWERLSDEGYPRLLNDMAAGKFDQQEDNHNEK
jgi:hypothetical protein